MAKTLKKTALKGVPVKAKPIKKPASPTKFRYVYYFGDGKADGDGKMKPLLGGKGANLAEMTRIGLPVPPGFTMTTEVCTYFYDNKRTYPREINDQVESALAKIERSVGKKLGIALIRYFFRSVQALVIQCRA
jgi:pyruvate,orthophosphate dikinase